MAQFVRIVTKILEDYIPKIYLPFINNIGVKGFKTTYNNEEVLLEIRRYMFEHIRNLNAVLIDFKRTECTVSGVKSQFLMAGLKIMEYIYDIQRRRPDTAKVIKILKWTKCNNVAEIRAFIGICVYFRI